MLSGLFILGYVAVLVVPGWCCLHNEYQTKDGQCCPMCLKGSVVRRDCKPDSSTGCRPCESGTFMNHLNGRDKCFTCTYCDSGHGLSVQKECTAVSDTVCSVLKGYFCQSWTDDTGCSSAVKHTKCPSGHRIKEPGNSRNDTVCERCKLGSFSLDGVECTAWSTCSETKVPGSATSDVVCASATRTRYCYIPFILLILTVVGLMISGRLTANKTSDSSTGVS